MTLWGTGVEMFVSFFDMIDAGAETTWMTASSRDDHFILALDCQLIKEGLDGHDQVYLELLHIRLI